MDGGGALISDGAAFDGTSPSVGILLQVDSDLQPFADRGSRMYVTHPRCIRACF